VAAPSFFSSVFVAGVLVVEVSAAEPVAGVGVTGVVGVLPNKPLPTDELATGAVPVVPAEVAGASAADCDIDPCVVVEVPSVELGGSPVVCAGTVGAEAMDRAMSNCRPMKLS